MDGNPAGFGPEPDQKSSGGQNALYVDFLNRAKALTEGDIAGADALVGDIAMSALPLVAFEDLASAIAAATGDETPRLVEQIFKGRWACLGETDAIPELPPDYRRLDAVPKKMTEQQALMEMNARFAYVHQAGAQGAVLYFGPTTVELRALQDLQEGLANCHVFVKSTDAKGTEKITVTPAVTWWHKHVRRRSYERTVFRPYRPYAPDGARLPDPDADATEYNLWTGFAMAPRRGSWRLLRHHLWAVICRKDRRNFKYLLRLLAHRVQRPGESPHVVVVLQSETEGTGKSLLIVVMERMIGPRHASTFSTPGDLLGTHNGQLAGLVFIGLEEMNFPGEHAMTRKLRAIITAPTWLINEKYLKPYRQDNFALMMLSTNMAWAVHAGSKARRYLVLDPDACHANDRAYFDPLWAEIERGGIAAMLYDLNRISLRGWSPQADLPRTRALARQQSLSADVFTKWAEDAVLNNGFDLWGGTAVIAPTGWSATGAQNQPVWGKEYTAQTLTKSIQYFARDATIREPVTAVGVGRWLSKCGFARRKTNGEIVWAIPDQAAFHAAARKAAGIA
jgi:Family of unknown function (DUF5906)